jgi:putative sigma-54 modulation protein
MDVTDAMGNHIRARIDKLPRYDDDIQSVTVTLDDEASGEEVEIIAKCHRDVLVTSASGHDMYAAIDAAFDKLERRISKLHDKLINNKARQAQKIAQAKREPQ